MTISAILEEFKDLNFVYNNCTRLDTLESMLDELLVEIKTEIKTKSDRIPWRHNDYNEGWVDALEWVMDNVIDKYGEGRSDAK